MSTVTCPDCKGYFHVEPAIQAFKEELSRTLARDVMTVIDRIQEGTTGFYISPRVEEDGPPGDHFVTVVVTAFRNDHAGHGQCRLAPGYSKHEIEKKIRKEVASAQRQAEKYAAEALSKLAEGIDVEAELADAEAFHRLEGQVAEAVALRPNGITLSEACHHHLLKDFSQVTVKQILDGLVDDGRLVAFASDDTCGRTVTRWFGNQTA